MATETVLYNTNNVAVERHVLAERFKNKICRNYDMTGACPYESRCMFAHGEHELRTMEMNLKDGLITEEAIKAYQRVMTNRSRMDAPLYDAPHHVVYHPSSPSKNYITTYTHNPYSLLEVYHYQYDEAVMDASSIGSDDESGNKQDPLVFIP